MAFLFHDFGFCVYILFGRRNFFFLIEKRHPLDIRMISDLYLIKKNAVVFLKTANNLLIFEQ